MHEQSVASTSHIGFLLLPTFSMIAFSNAVEPLRMANYLSRKQLYRWSVLSVDGQPVEASNGLQMSPIAKPGKPKQYDMLVVCAGWHVREATNAAVLSLVRHFAEQGVPLASLCTGAYVLAKAGLLNGYRSVIHWENLLSTREEFPNIEFTSDLFVFDRDRYTCSGGTAPLDFMCHFIRQKGGKSLAADVSAQFIVDRIRDNGDVQNIPLLTRLGTGHEMLVDAVLLMEQHIETPLSLEALANELAVSLRHLERLFKRYLSVTPAQYYLDLRLRRARELLLQTHMNVMEVTVACGFLSSSHFSKSYRNVFGYPPSQEREHSLSCMSVKKSEALPRERVLA